MSYLNGLVVFHTFFYLSLNLAIRSSWSEPQSSPGLVFADLMIQKHCNNQIRSDQISHSVVSNSLQSHESLHSRPPCPSPTPGVHSDSRPSSQWCHPAISSSVVPFSSFPQSLPASESIPISQLFAWGGQSTGVSALASFLPKNWYIIFIF